MHAQRGDGNDVLAVWRAVRDARQRAREGGGPTFVELRTYRLGGHSTSDDPRVYRDDDEVALHRGADPLLRLKRHIEQQGVWNDALDADWHAVCDAEIKACVRVAEQKPAPSLEALFTDVFAEPPADLREQQRLCVRGRDDERDEDG